MSFSLAEHNSVPEMVEIRVEDPEEVPQGNEGDTLDEALTRVDKIMRDIDAQAGAMREAQQNPEN